MSCSSRVPRLRTDVGSTVMNWMRLRQVCLALSPLSLSRLSRRSLCRSLALSLALCLPSTNWTTPRQTLRMFGLRWLHRIEDNCKVFALFSVVYVAIPLFSLSTLNSSQPQYQ